MTILKEYLQTLVKSNEIALIGPLHNGEKILESEKIFIDGGTKFRNSQEGVSVGDNDSTNIPLDLVLQKEKDYSDLSYVLNQLTDNFHFVNLYGFQGGAKDHELINYGEVHRFLEKRKIETLVCFDDNIKAFSAGKWEFNLMGSFSLFCFSECQLKMMGACQYQFAESVPFSKLSSRGLSNEGSGRVLIHTDSPLFVFINGIREPSR